MAARGTPRLGRWSSLPARTAAIVLTLPRSAPTGTLSISSSVGARYAIDATHMGHLPLAANGVGSIPMRVEVSSAGHRPWVGTVAVPPGKAVSLDVRLAREGERRADTLFYVGAGTTLALVVGGVVTGLLALDAKHTFNGYVAEGRTRDDADAARAANRGEVLVSITNVLWIGAAVVGVGTAGWLFFGGSPAPSTAETRER